MPLTDAQRRALRKYDAKHYTTIAVKLPTAIAETFRAYCTQHNVTPSASLRHAVTQYITGALPLPDNNINREAEQDGEDS